MSNWTVPQIYILEPQQPWFGWKRSLFRGLTFKNRGQLGSRYVCTTIYIIYVRIYSVHVYFYTHVHIHTCFNTSISVGKRQHHIWPRNSAAVVAMGSNRTGAQCDSRTISLRPPTRHTWTRTVRTGLCVLHQAFWPQHIAMVNIVKQKLERSKISKLR